MSCIMGDYVAGFLGSSEGCNWNMNAFDVRLSVPPFFQIPKRLQVINTPDLKVDRGQGNHVSVEFNILYRVWQ